MRRAVFGIALIVGIVSGASCVYAQSNGDSDWPTTAVIDDAPVKQKARQKPIQGSNPQQADISPNGQPQAPAVQGPAPAAENTTLQLRNFAVQQPSIQQVREPRIQQERGPRIQQEREPRQRRPAAPNAGDGDVAALSLPAPPLPGRRDTSPPVLHPAAQMVVNLAQTIPAPPPDDGLGKLIGQMLIVGFQGAASDENWPRQISAQIESGKIGGVLVMSHNMLAPAQLTKLTTAFRRTKAQVAPFIAVDQGGGQAQHLPSEKGFQQYTSAADIGKSNDPLSAYNLYQRMAIELAVYGFNVNFGPVVDLEQLGGNGAAGVHERRYGSQPKHVAAFAKAFRLAHHGEGLLTVLRHFPGPANLGAGAEAPWDAAALEPYRQLIAGGNADMVMVGHLAHPEFSDEPGLPASLSRKAIQTKLRAEIGFKGVVISDDLEAVAARFPLEESVVRAISAGNDLLLVSNQDRPSPDLPERFATIVRQAVTTGVLTRERLQASYDRIIAAKQSLSQAAREMASAKQTEADEEKPAAP